MAKFSIRVELHGADWADYTNLAASLQRIGVVDTIVDDYGVRYKLPPAEYNYEGAGNIQQVHEAVKSAVATIGRVFEVFTNEVTVRMWSGLKQV